MSETRSIPSPLHPAKKRVRTVLIAFLAGAALTGLLWTVFHKETLYKGKPISYWVDGACTGYDLSTAFTFRQEVTNIGPAAIPYLIKRLRVSDRYRKMWFSLRASLPQSWQERFPDTRTAGEIRYGAMKTLGMFGPAAKKALPDLWALIRNTNVTEHTEIAELLWAIGRETNLVLQICTNIIAPGSKENPMNALGLLIQLQSAAAPAAPYALAVLQDTNSKSRINAAGALGAAQVSTPEIRAALLKGANEEQDKGLQMACAVALWRIDGQYAPQYAPLAIQLMLERYIELRKRSPQSDPDFAHAMKILDLDPAVCIPILNRLLASDSAEMRKEAATALDRIESGANIAQHK